METSAAIQGPTGEIGASPTVQQVAVRLRLVDEDVIEALEVRNAYSPSYLDAPVGPDEEAGPGLPALEPGYAVVHDEVTLSPLVARLPAAEREMVRLRFVEQMTQSQIGALLGVSQMQVSRVLAGVLAKLRTWIGEDTGE